MSIRQRQRWEGEKKLQMSGAFVSRSGLRVIVGYAGVVCYIVLPVAYSKEQLLADARRQFPLAELYRSLKLPGEPRIGYVHPCPFRPGDDRMTFVVLDAFSWRDVGRSGDAFDLLVLLRGHDPQESPESAVREFLQLAGLFPLVENVANSVDVEEPVPVNHNGTSPTKSRRKQPADLLVLIPGNAPISQTELFETARARGINRWYARDLINDLLAMEQIFIWKLPRPNAKSAIGYARVPQR